MLVRIQPLLQLMVITNSCTKIRDKNHGCVGCDFTAEINRVAEN
jgi:hypothetical protein